MDQCCEKCQGLPNYSSCECHKSNKFDHCEICTDQEFLELYPLKEFKVSTSKFALLRGKYRYSRRAKRLYKILYGQKLSKNPTLNQRIDVFIIMLFETLGVNFVNHSCKKHCNACLPFVEWYPQRYKHHLRMNEDEEDKNANGIFLNVSSYILSIINDDNSGDEIQRVCEETRFTANIENLMELE